MVDGQKLTMEVQLDMFLMYLLVVNEAHTIQVINRSTTKYVEANGGLNVRKGPSTSYAVSK